MKEIGVGIIGFGTVGQGTCRILEENREAIARQVGAPVRVAAVADIRIKELGAGLADSIRQYNDAAGLIADPDVAVVCELIGGVKPAGDFVRSALDAGKHVVTANKELMAKQGPELLSIAEQRSLDFYFEASVGGGIPIISPLRVGLAGNQVERIIGIVNGTTNFILTKMAEGGGSMAEVLKEAQTLGYAEADPTNDIEGYDARYKLTILASLGFHAHIHVEQIICQGITQLDSRDVNYARELGYQVKLLAIAKLRNGKIEARVHPALIPFSHPLASVSGVNNAIFVTGNSVGNVMFFGPGAGGLAAGSAVVGDIVEIGRNIQAGATGRMRAPEFCDISVQRPEDIVTRHYVRLRVADKYGVLAKIAAVFADFEVSIAALEQKEAHNGFAEIIFLTHEVVDRDFLSAIEKILELDVVDEVCSLIRVEE